MHDDYELPDELDFTRLKFVGIGLDALEKHARSRARTIELDPDVARVFGSSKSVNNVLRAIIHGISSTGKRKKSA